MYSLIVLVLGYICGNFSTGYIVGKLNHIDLKSSGSGNIGSTNALRTLGFFRGGLPTLLGDVLKTIVPCLIVKYIFFNGLQGDSLGFHSTDYYVLLCGFGVVLGHNYPVLLRFKGGKGIACTGGTLLAFNLPMTLIPLAIFISVTAITRYVSLGSIIGLISIPVTIAVTYHFKWGLVLISSLFTILGIIRHRANIRRLADGTENKIGKNKKDS